MDTRVRSCNSGIQDQAASDQDLLPVGHRPDVQGHGVRVVKECQAAVEDTQSRQMSVGETLKADSV